MCGICRILFVALFVCISSDHCLCDACNTRGVDGTTEASRQPAQATSEPRHLNSVEMEAFKQVFLTKLGLTTPPSKDEIANYTMEAPSGNDLEVRFDQNVRGNRVGRHRERRSRTTQSVSFVGKVSTHQSTSLDNGIHHMYVEFDNFTLSNWPSARIVSAKLQLLFSQFDETHVGSSNRRDRGSVNVFHTLVDEHSSKELLDSRTVPLGDSIWRTFDVTDAVQLWQQDEDEDVPKEVEIQSDSSELMKALENTSNILKSIRIQGGETLESSSLTNHLRLSVTFVAEVSQKPRRRQTRQTQLAFHSRGTDCIAQETTCCREQRTVSFADLGWDYWIVSPNHFTLYHCRGSCPQGHRTANNYATIKSQLHVLNPSEWEAPCCTASSLGDLTIHHLTPKGPDEAVMEDIIVEECSCV